MEDATQPVTPYFLTNDATSLESTTLTGASWYVLNTAANGLPDADGRVFIMQVTTAGSISGQINFQVFPLGVGADQQQVSVPFDKSLQAHSKVVVETCPVARTPRLATTTLLPRTTTVLASKRMSAAFAAAMQRRLRLQRQPV